MRAIVARPRGFCAGVERAIRAVELALEMYGPPVYVRKEIVHNYHVVQRLRAMGATFVDELDEVPCGAVTILSAHGSPPEVYAEAGRRRLRLIDATCPLVRKVHVEVRRYVKRGYRIVLIGHAGHDEVIGTTGQAREATILVEHLADVERLQLSPDERGIILTQTTLSQDDTREIVASLQRRFPHLELPPTDDICYATQNRQSAVKALSDRIDLLLVVGSQNSSNSRRLTEVARARGIASHLVDGPDQIDPAWLRGVQCIGVTSGASAPEDIVQGVLAYLRAQGVDPIDEVDAPDEGVTFTLPKLTPLTAAGEPVE
ncbi:MAG: 4-hydroxy-3-methylbut-2-enyl diphosphate reductase [Phycisphaerae bacterium]|nr:4-hydroxy-3-methylbut-2-enyl diphosphate reductase [Phycisphaerae bacterium]HQL55282.1 4-hydroxy-3-methylbut-2-enyl diphosphate reductase [Phycisphaerae bacterium]